MRLGDRSHAVFLMDMGVMKYERISGRVWRYYYRLYFEPDTTGNNGRSARSGWTDFISVCRISGRTWADAGVRVFEGGVCG